MCSFHGSSSESNITLVEKQKQHRKNELTDELFPLAWVKTVYWLNKVLSSKEGYWMRKASDEG